MSSMHKFEVQLDSEAQSMSATSLTGAMPIAVPPIDFKKVPWSKSLELLKLLAANGIITWKGNSLLVDFFSIVSFVYEVKKTASGELALSGKLIFKKDIPIQDCAFLAPCNPVWFIYEKQLKVLKTDISWLEIQKLPRLIDAEELEDLIEEAKEPNSPQVELLFEGAFEADPTPLLILTDRKGAFANLMMCYGKDNIVSYSDHGKNARRNLKAESYWEKDLLETGYIKKTVDKSHYYCPLDQVGKSIAFLLELGWDVQDQKGNLVLLETSRNIACKETTDKVELSGELKFGTFQADLKNVFGAFNRRDQFIDLGSGKTGLLGDHDPLAVLAEEIEGISAHTSVNKHMLGLLEIPEIQWDHPLKSDEVYLPSDLFKGSLRPYQQQGLNWLMQLNNSHLHGILADEMGLGKTVQIIAFLSLQNLKAKHLIVVPTSLLFNWERELEKFLPSIPLYRHHGPNRKQELPETGVILTSYHTLQNDSALFRQQSWDAIILDEAQVVKNPDSQMARSLYTLKSRFRIAMTGTVIENHSKELWAHFHFLMPGMLGDRTNFEKQLSIATVDSRYVSKIRKMILPFILRRKKEDVVKDLPPLDEYTVFVEMPPSQRSLYDQFLAATRQGVLKKVRTEGSGKHRMEIFEALLRLRQIACSPLLVSSLLPHAEEESGKLQALLMDLEAIREEGKKALVFSQFSSMLHLIAKKLQDQGIPYCLLEGETKDRETQVRKFQEDPAIPFFLLTLKAGGVGLNLTAADYVLLYDPWWHDAIDAQAISRAHRIGQTKPVIAKRYITTESIEEKMLTLKKAKSALFSNLLENDSIESFSEQDLLFLLE